MEPQNPNQHYALALLLATAAPDPQRQADYAKLARQMLSDFDSLDGATSGAIQDAVLMCLSILRPSGDTTTNHKPMNKELLSDAHVKFAIVNALSFYSEFHDNSLDDVDLKFWRQCFNADASDLREHHDLTVDRLSTKMANYHVPQRQGDTSALNTVAQMLRESEWNSDLFDRVAEVVRNTGREV